MLNNVVQQKVRRIVVKLLSNMSLRFICSNFESHKNKWLWFYDFNTFKTSW